MKKNPGQVRYAGTRTSPTTPEPCVDRNVGLLAKSSSSEHGRLSTSGNRRNHIGAAALIPYHTRNRLPSKWDDAERWITSPISGQGYAKTPIAQLSQGQRKSKSGPMASPGLMYSSNHLPKSLLINDAKARTSAENLGFNMKSDDLDAEYTLLMRRAKAHGLLDLLDEDPVQLIHGDNKLNDTPEDEESVAAKVVNYRDVATQISQKICSSSQESLSFSIRTSSNLAQDTYIAKEDVRDVQVDQSITTAATPNQSKNQELEVTKKGVDCVKSWNSSNVAKTTSKLQRMEEKISAWENLQKAKAEASIQKLEMELEKKRSANMEKISNRLRAAQMKVDAMRSSLSEKRSPDAPSVQKGGICSCVNVKRCSIRRCFIHIGK